MKILVAMSGGVDSTVAALLLQQQGHDVVGAYMKNWINEDEIVGECPWMQDIVDARAVCDRLGIEFRVVNLMREYRAKVVDYLLDGYRAGLTPNPDVLCNREIKFGAFLDYATREGFDALATGHYAIRREVHPRRLGLFEGIDPNKDQSYFLALLSQEQLARARFPLGELTKTQVRALAREAGLPNAAKKDSQGICFIGNVRMQDFLAHYVPDSPGEIVRATDGVVLGRHRGLHFYTIGQRRGIGIPSNTDHRNYVVVGRDTARNRLLVAFDDPAAPGLWAHEATVDSLRFNSDPLESATRLLARVRYRDPLVPARFEPRADGTARLVFEIPQRALAPGQVVALHDGPRLLGGGFFSSVSPGITFAPRQA
ncbi:tRNA 2-thiouridine(34) synthase MnmA [Opitutales bacterium ASA1]|uniref:tRNA 2-thiouridine(34) synthase MnmA n=1 Tax=Congregicoccus parvus TaxID=3081749 RepID=UPI002B2F385B|nr:tRNA 2-thiouridine(34) synthase MnmA [Opitutales bacterium ASA1]